LEAAVPFYGGQPTEDIEKIKSPTTHFGELDKSASRKVGQPMRKALKRNTVKKMSLILPKCKPRLSHDDYTMYDREVAELAWDDH